MRENHTAELAFGYLGAVCWSIQLIPQIYKSWRTKSTNGLSQWLVLSWGIAGAFLGAYVILQDLNVGLILQPQCFGTLSLISWGQCQRYTFKRSRLVSTSMVVLALVILGGLEVGMVYAVRPSYRNGEGETRAVLFLGVFSAMVIALALFPQYYEIYRHREVIGISIVFMLVDMIGGVFSDLSLVFKEEFDVLAAITYTLVVVLDGVVVVAALILNPRARRRRERDAAGLTLAEASPANTMSLTTAKADVERQHVPPTGATVGRENTPLTLATR